MPAPPAYINYSFIVQGVEQRATTDEGFIIILKLRGDSAQQLRQQATFATHPFYEGLGALKIRKRWLRHAAYRHQQSSTFDLYDRFGGLSSDAKS